MVKTLLSRWGKDIDREHPWPEYPRPQLKRENWRNLNGPWEYCISDTHEQDIPERFDGEIIVPFSPESVLSAVNRRLLPGQTLWYRRNFTVERPAEKGRLMLNFGAVDQCCTVYCNNKKAGTHEGGYWPFSIDISDMVTEGVNTVTLAVHDDTDRGRQAFGKQSLKPGGIWYSAQSGIWQTVWTEWVPERYISALKITALYDEAAVQIELEYGPSLQGAAEENVPVKIEVYAGETLAASIFGPGRLFKLPLPSFKSWSPESPFLYTLRVKAGEDRVESYFGMRKFGIVKDRNGIPRPGLNGKPVFHNGLLDQGYWSDGLYTPPCEEAMLWELTEIKRLGFNMLRKHIKIENLRWYYHCDRLGILVWQDFVNGGGPYKLPVTTILPLFWGIRLKDSRYRSFGREDAAGRAVFERDMARTVALLYNTVSLAVWVPFNEGWGQFDSIRITEMLRRLDGSRIIDHASGWHDQGGGDLYSRHVYFKRFRFAADPFRKKQGPARTVVLSEFGGYSCSLPGHCACDKPFGYRFFRDTESLSRAYEALYCKEIFPAVKRGLSATVYTQVSDVEAEINGIFTYDREKTKLDEEMLVKINRELGRLLTEDCTDCTGS